MARSKLAVGAHVAPEHPLEEADALRGANQMRADLAFVRAALAGAAQ